VLKPGIRVLDAIYNEMYVGMYVARTLDTYEAAILQLAVLRSRSTVHSGEIELSALVAAST
jgi:hypothetical protein